MHTSDGHRQRVKERFRKEGLDNFDEVHALELLLFYAIPRVDTKPLARALLDRFGSYSQVMEATAMELECVEGVGRNVSTFLTLITSASRYYQTRHTKRPTILTSSAMYGAYFVDCFCGKRNETVYLLCLDAKGKVLNCFLVGEGDVNSANIPMRKLVELALMSNASAVVLAHNHPSGVAIPSLEDKVTTERLAVALGTMGIVLADHIIVADRDYISMVMSGIHDPLKYC